MGRSRVLSLKVFGEQVDRRLETLSSDELRAILRALASDVSPAGRQAFLDELDRRAPDAHEALRLATDRDELLADIEELDTRLRSEMDEADPFEPGWDDEDAVFEGFEPELEALFDRAEAAFDCGEMALAREAYDRLLALVSLEDEYGRTVSTGQTELRGVRPRSLRAVYETEPASNRCRALFAAMAEASPWIEPAPTLEALIEASPEPLPDRDRFLAGWIALLRTKGGSLADRLLREAVGLAHGTDGLAELARTEGKRRPRAFLDWVVALQGDAGHREALEAAEEALETLPPKRPLRAAIADRLYESASALGDAPRARAARWEAFAALPTLPRLLDLRDVAPSRAAEGKLLSRAVERIKEYIRELEESVERRAFDADGDEDVFEDELEESVWIERSMLEHASLLARDWAQARWLADSARSGDRRSFGDAAALVIAFFLVRLAGKSPDALPPNLERLWHTVIAGAREVPFHVAEDAEDRLSDRLNDAYAAVLSRFSKGEGGQVIEMTWCLETARQRVKDIVGNLQRRLYSDAAVLTAACVEVLDLRQATGEARSFLAETRERFPRHRAFLGELDDAVRRLPAHLQDIGSRPQRRRRRGP